MQQIDNLRPATRPIQKITEPLVRFLHIESASGIVLGLCALIALAIGNSPFAGTYQAFWNKTFTIGMGSFNLSYPLWYWVNDGLMALFFFVVGLEIKRELIHGELNEKRKVILPVAAAAGGAIVPAAIFVAIYRSGPGLDGWAIPMATDIAFVVGILAVLGSRIPNGLKVFLLSLAIVDDIIAVVIIAAFYSKGITLSWLLAAVVGFGVVAIMRRAGVRSIGVYVIVGTAIWLFTLKSGIHPTVAGVFLGLMTPARQLESPRILNNVVSRVRDILSGEPTEKEARELGSTLDSLVVTAKEAQPPLDRLERALHPWVAFIIMPVFALANTAVPISLASLSDTLAVAIAAGLLFGKPIGIGLTAWFVIKAGWTNLPGRTTWPMVIGGGFLAGIGFTMSLFIASLGLEGALLDTAKGGILLGSFIAATLGVIFLSRTPSTSDRTA